MLTSTERAYEIIAKDIIGLKDNEYKTVADDIDDAKAFHIRLSDIPSNRLFSNDPADATVFDIKSIEKIEKDDSLLNKANRVFLSKSINAAKQLYGHVEKLKFYQEKATDLAISDGKKGWDNKWLQAASIYASALELPGALSAQQIWKFNVEREGSAVFKEGGVIPGGIPGFTWDPVIAPVVNSTIVDPQLGEEAFKATNKAIENAGKDFIKQNTLASSGNKITNENSPKEVKTQGFDITQIQGFGNLR